jgi:two-component system cell cycle sensor histidine kinase/response regulator CckA
MSGESERAEARFRILFEAMADGVVFQNPDGRITFVNRAAERILGFSRDDLLGLTSTDPGSRAIREDGRVFPAHEHPYRIALLKGEPVGEVTMGVFNPREESVRWILVSAIPLFEEGETTPYEVYTTFTDITEMRRAREALKESEARYRHLFESAGDAILVMKDENILDGNRRAQELFKCRRDEILGRTIHELAPPEQPDGTESRGKLMVKIRGALDGRPQVFEWTHLKCDGTPFDAEVTLNPVQVGGRVHLHAIVRDNTERKRAEAEREGMRTRLIQAQKMETVGHLAGGIAHDFNNLLAPILAYSELLLLNMTPDNPRYTEIKIIYEAGQRAKDLVRRLLAYGRRQILEMQIMDLNEVVSRLETILRRTLREDIRIELFLAPDHVLMKGDPAQIEQVIMNLVVNAQDAMADPGVLSITTSSVILDASYCVTHPDVKPGPYVMLAVSDTGQGMEKETLQYIFEPFFTTKDAGKGTGLGLATVYAIVKQHRGNISVNSEVGQGTTFKIYFPLVHGKPEEAHASEVAFKHGLTSETIMVVEDDKVVRDAVVAVLKEAGYGVVTAPDPAACVAALDQHQDPVHLLLTDVVLPGKNGRDLYNELRIRYPHLKVLYMSGYSDVAIADSGVLGQETHFIEKPFSIQALIQKVRQAIGR